MYKHIGLGSQSILMSEIRIKISGFSMKLMVRLKTS